MHVLSKVLRHVSSFEDAAGMSKRVRGETKKKMFLKDAETLIQVQQYRRTNKKKNEWCFAGEGV